MFDFLVLLVVPKPYKDDKMNNIISYLEELGQNADFQLDKIDFEAILDNEDFDADVKEALLNRDPEALKMILDARTKIVCLLVPAEDDDDDQEQEDNDDDSDSSESKLAAVV